MITIFHFTSSLGRGGKERQIATIYKYSSGMFNNKIMYLNDKKGKDYINEYNLLKEDLIKIKSTSFFFRLFEVTKVLLKNKPTIVYCWDNLQVIFSWPAKMINRKLIIINGSVRHGVLSLKWTHIFRFLVLLLSKNVVANSYAGLKANKLKCGSVLMNGLDEKFFFKKTVNQNDEIREKLNIEKDGVPILISVANFVPYKDYNTVLYALKKVKEKGIGFHYIIVGDGPNRLKIEKLVDRLNINENVRLVGSVANVVDYLSISDVFIHSSKGEGCSNAIMEAMINALPIIATDTGGTPEIVDEENGILFGYKQCDRLYRAIMVLLVNLEKRKLLGDNSYKKAVECFKPEKMIENYVKIIGGIFQNEKTDK